MLSLMLETQRPPWEDDEFLGEIRRASKQAQAVVIIDPVAEQYLALDVDETLFALLEACRARGVHTGSVCIVTGHDGTLDGAKAAAEEACASLRADGKTVLVVSRNLDMLERG